MLGQSPIEGGASVFIACMEGEGMVGTFGARPRRDVGSALKWCCANLQIEVRRRMAGLCRCWLLATGARL